MNSPEARRTRAMSSLERASFNSFDLDSMNRCISPPVRASALISTASVLLDGAAKRSRTPDSGRLVTKSLAPGTRSLATEVDTLPKPFVHRSYRIRPGRR